MPANLLDGKAVAKKVREEVMEEVEKLKSRGIVPSLHVLLIGENPASQIYVRNKEKAAKRVGIESVTYRLPKDISKEEVLSLVEKLNRDSKVHGILIQLPLPDHLPTNQILEAVDPKKDADGFHPFNLGLLLSGNATVLPCTPKGIMRLIDETGIDPKGKEAVVIGRSVIVGKPTALLLLQRHATVTICHSQTTDLSFHTRRADILVVAAGKPHLVKGDMIKEGAVVIDVGINRQPDGSLTGDVVFEEAMERASWVTPVPGGVGPMTVAMLLKNTVTLAKRFAT